MVARALLVGGGDGFHGNGLVNPPLSALIYRLVANEHQALQTNLYNYAIDFRRAHAAGMLLAVPRVAELLAEAVFQAPVGRLGSRRTIGW